MMKSTLLTLLVLAAPMLSLQAAAPAADVEGAKDDPAIKRYHSTFISRYSDKDFDRYVFPLGKAVKSGKVTEGKYEKSLMLEGRVTRRAYHSTEADRSTLELFRNYQQELTAAGFETLYLLEDGRQTQGAITFIDDAFTPSLQSVPAETLYLSAKKTTAEGTEIYASLWAGKTASVRPIWAPRGAPFALLDLITVGSMDTRMVLVKSDEMQRRMDTDGSISLYGIYFDFNKDSLKPESAPTLEQIAALLKAQPALRLYVVGHTDAIGSLPSNMDLSDRRAKAVVNALVNQHGIASDRLAPAGVAFLAPVATNTTEPGRAKNRRVVLMPQEVKE